MPRISPRLSVVLAVALLVGSGHGWPAQCVDPAAPASPLPPKEFSFHRDHIIGTSLDLWITASRASDAETAEQVTLDEIERLRMVFSTYDPTSEISRLNRATGPVPASAEMIQVLRGYEVWEGQSGGAFSGRVGELVRLWRDAEAKNREPDPGTLSRIAAQLRQPGWHIDERARTVTRLTEQPLNLNAIAKGYIIQQAIAAIRSQVPGVIGGLLNLGGDIAAWGTTDAGRSGWPVAIQDPFHSEENATPIGGFILTDKAVATSGGYQRFYTVGGTRYSHIFDPRTARPAGGVAGATVLARDNVTANALATTLCVLAPGEGLKLVASTPGAECLIVAADGHRFASPGFDLQPVISTRPVLAPADDEKKDAADKWPAGFQVNVAVELPKLDAKRYRRPYVAVWIENADGKPVRSLSVWGNAQKYLKDLPEWWKFAKEDQALVKAVTRATRGPGKYDVVWDGKDDKGKALPQGTYTVKVEVHREFGKLVRQTGTIDCKAEAAKVTLDKNEETADTLVEYGKKKK